jgi:hypothetical protein
METCCQLYLLTVYPQRKGPSTPWIGAGPRGKGFMYPCTDAQCLVCHLHWLSQACNGSNTCGVVLCQFSLQNVLVLTTHFPLQMFMPWGLVWAHMCPSFQSMWFNETQLQLWSNMCSSVYWIWMWLSSWQGRNILRKKYVTTLATPCSSSNNIYFRFQKYFISLQMKPFLM